MYHAIKCKSCGNWFVQIITKLSSAMVRCRRDGCKPYKLKKTKELGLDAKVSPGFTYADDARDWMLRQMEKEQ